MVDFPVGPLACRSATFSPEAAGGGAIALIEPGDLIEINIPERTINVKVDDATLAERRANMDQRDRAWQPM